ncbi:iron-sulfur cluster assembly protein [Lebetimonas sp. JS032]|uniref:iron-sulfur cluster assembly protein n=1 Tax=Lebetimonas sp. JS032 TaxID=990070 RepID=UPI000463F55C|nr:iron-sulfur cluster assembly protein [Lebetimonas sp. JS032]
MDFFKIVQTIESIQHPAIATSLVNLGMLENIDFKGNTVKATFVWPFEGIPIKEQIINSVKTPLENMGLKLEYNERIMSEVEKQKFLELEKKYWRGGNSGCGV